MITKQVSSKANIKQSTDQDFPVTPRFPVLAKMAPVDSTLNQTVINFPFQIDTINNPDALILTVDGKTLSSGSTNDFTFTSVDSFGMSSQVTLTQNLSAGLNIQAWKLGLKKETEMAQDQRFTNLYNSLNEGFQGFIIQPQMTPTTATGTPASGSYHSTVVGRKPILDMRSDLGVRHGVERIMTQNAFRLQDEFGPNGESVFGVVGDTQNRIRLVGGFRNIVDVNGQFFGIVSSTTAEYAEITFYGTGLNLITIADNAASSRDHRVSVDGGAEGSNIFPASLSSIINGRNTSSNQVFPAASGLALGVHTVKIRTNNANGIFIYGFEVINQSANVLTNQGTGYIRGLPAILAGQNSTALSTGVTGTRGGRMVTYIGTDGVLARAFRPVNAAQANLSAADHTNEEVVRTYNFREFGAGRADDFSLMSSIAAATRAFTLDDGTTTLTFITNASGGIGFLTPREGLQATGAGNFISLTFVGTGLDIFAISDGSNRDYAVTVDGISAGTASMASSTAKQLRIVSGLPYGTHIVKLTPTANGSFGIADFITYQPKKPAIPAGVIELSDYNVMANFVANTTAGVDTIATGILRKLSTREFVYTGTGWVVTLAASSQGGFGVTSATNGDALRYTFYGTGFELRPNATSACTFTINVDGSTNLSGFTTSAYGAGIAITPATGTVTQTVATSGYGVSVSGLALGVHTIILTKTAGAGGLGAEAIEVITPLHVAKDQSDPYQNTLPVGSQAISDSRKFTPVKDLAVTKKAFARATGVASSSTTTSTVFIPCPDMSVAVKSEKGGKLTISIRINWRNSVTNGYGIFAIFINGIQASNDSYAQTYVATADEMMSFSDVFFVGAGVHKIDIYWRTNSGTLTAAGVNRTLTVEET